MSKLPAGLKLRNDTWYFIAMIDGTRHYKSLGIPRECKAQAIQAVKEYWLRIAREGLGISKKDPLIEMLFDKFIAFRKPEVTPRHLEIVDGYFHRVVKQFGNVRISDFSASDFLTWLNGMDTRRTAQLIQIEVNAAFRHALRMKDIQENPLENMPKLKHRQKTKEPLTRSEFIEFGRLAQGYSCGKLLLFLMKTGTRFSEAALLQWQRVDLDQGEFRLRSEDTKTRKARTVGLSQDLCRMLFTMRPQDAKPSDLVFLNDAGNAFDSHNVRRAVRKIGQRIGRPDITTHSLRHSYATLIRDSGAVQVEQVQKELGHTSARTTGIYDHDSPARQRKLSDNLPVFDIRTA